MRGIRWLALAAAAALACSGAPAGSGEGVRTIRLGQGDAPGHHVVGGAVTIFHFSAGEAGAGRAIEARLEALARKRADVRLMKIDLGGDGAPARERFRIDSLPSVWIYGKDGQLLARGLSSASQIETLVREAR
jgi:hypothetical protein